MGWIWIFHFPGVLSGSQLVFRGVVWFHSMATRVAEVPEVMAMRIQMVIFWPRSCTTRSRKKPIDSLARALPMMAKVFAM